MTSRLVDRTPSLGPDELLARFVPPRRFADVRFSTYRPDPAHPSQAEAVSAVETFASEVVAPARPARRWGRRAEAAGRRPARYLDGGYGVGKTHLLAALWHQAAPALPAAYLSFTELTATVGYLGMAGAIEAFERFGLLCIDEFELDDVANTLLCVTFLRSVIDRGARVATTSNSLPDRLGEGRFNADDFTREIAAIAAHFELVRLDGPDYRRRDGAAPPPPLDGAAFDAAAGCAGPRTTVDDFDAVVAHLRRVHPVQYPALVEGVDTVLLRGLRPLDDQGDALLLVALVDELYDAGVGVVASGCPLEALFPPSYRTGGYRKKYGRCESRLGALVREASSSN